MDDTNRFSLSPSKRKCSVRAFQLTERSIVLRRVVKEPSSCTTMFTMVSSLTSRIESRTMQNSSKYDGDDS